MKLLYVVSHVFDFHNVFEYNRFEFEGNRHVSRFLSLKRELLMRKRFSAATVGILVILSVFVGAMLNNGFSGDNIYEQINKFRMS